MVSGANVTLSGKGNGSNSIGGCPCLGRLESGVGLTGS